MSVTLLQVLGSLLSAAVKKTIQAVNVGAVGYIVGNQFESDEKVTSAPIIIKQVIASEEKSEDNYKTYILIICAIIFVLLLVVQLVLKHFDCSKKRQRPVPRARINADFEA